MIVTDVEALRMKCEDVLPEEIESLRSKLEEGLKYSEMLGRAGIGLSCPQIGIPKKMAIVRIKPARGDVISVDLVNARIDQGYHRKIFRNEGCLSFPNEYIDTMRYHEIVVKDNLADPESFVATGLLAVCIQHELDHLEGILLPDMPNDPLRKV